VKPFKWLTILSVGGCVSSAVLGALAAQTVAHPPGKNAGIISTASGLSVPLPGGKLPSPQPAKTGQRGQAPAAPTFTAKAIPSHLTAGDKLTIVAHGQPYAHLSIEANDLSFTQILNLLPKTADESGQASWRFQVSKEYRADVLPIIVTEKDAGTQKLILTVPVAHPSEAQQTLPLSFVEFPKVAHAGARVNVTVKTVPGAKARIEAQGSGFPQASALLDRSTGQDGLATWTWELPTDYAANIMPIVVTVDDKERESKITGAIRVLPPPSQPTGPQKNLVPGQAS